jgi:hypothetical protein
MFCLVWLSRIGLTKKPESVELRKLPLPFNTTLLLFNDLALYPNAKESTALDALPPIATPPNAVFAALPIATLSSPALKLPLPSPIQIDLSKPLSPANTPIAT